MSAFVSSSSYTRSNTRSGSREHGSSLSEEEYSGPVEVEGKYHGDVSVGMDPRWKLGGYGCAGVIAASLVLAIIATTVLNTPATTPGVCAGPNICVSQHTNHVVLKSSPSDVTASVAYVSHTSEDDIVYLIMANFSIEDHTPIKSWKLMSIIPDYLNTGVGDFTVRIHNHRAPLQLLYVLESGEKVHTVNIEFENYNEPLGAHLMLGADPTEMRLQWNTRDLGNPRVWYGTSEDNLDTIALASSETYTAEDMCAPPATTKGYVFPGYFHTATLTGLTPNTRYYYKYGDSSLGTDTGSFKSSPGANDPVDLLYIGDIGMRPADDGAVPHKPSSKGPLVVDHIVDVAGGRDLMLHLGDISYARGYVPIWDRYMTQMQPAFKKMPVMTAMGNHEREPTAYNQVGNRDGGGGECGVPYTRWFPMPNTTVGAQGAYKQWFSFDHGPIHYVIASTEDDPRPGSPQYVWLDADLGAVDRDKTPWVVFAVHRQDFTYTVQDNSQFYVHAPDFIKWFRFLVEKHDVDVVLAGHWHSYGRSCPARNGTCLPYNSDGTAPAPVHFLIGTGGWYITDWFDWYAELPDTCDVYVTKFGIGLAHVTRTRFQLEFVDTKSREVLDSVDIINKWVVE